MDGTPQERAPRARCYRCGSSRITRICHHCGRIGCSAHITPTPRLAGWPLSRELWGLDMGKKPAYHCPSCVHSAGPALAGMGIATALVGAVVLWLNLWLGLVLVLLGVVIVGGSYVAGRRKGARVQKPPLPVVPRLEELSLREELHGRIVLNPKDYYPDSDYRAPPCPVEGRLTADLALGKADRRRLEGYIRRRRIQPGSSVRFRAGFLMLQGQASISLSRDFPYLCIPLDDMTSRYPVFDAKSPRVSSSYRINRTYDLIADEEVRRVPVPVWIIPTIASRSDQRALELQIQWVGKSVSGVHLELESVESLKLKVPVRWGNPVNANKAVISSPRAGHEGNGHRGSQKLRLIEWAQLRPSQEESQRKRLELVVQFEDKIESWHTIYGRLDMVFSGAVSGIEQINFYSALGDRRVHSFTGSVKTHVVLDFELSLANTRYQEVRLVPDRKMPEDQERREAEDSFPVIPNDETVIRLTNDLSDEGYYIKRIIENPPRSGTRANLIRRYWDIAGRRYVGVYPIDFHIILTGEEIHHGGILAHSGTTKARITVQGSYANQHMQNRVAKAWDTLHRLTVKKLQSLSYPARPGPDPLGGWGDPIGGPAPTSGGNGAGPDHAPMNPARLLELLGLLDEAFLHGRISDERYRKMQSWVQDQLDGS
jgi:hypothetical protein